MPLTLWYSGAPFAVAIIGVFAYRILALWLPVPGSLALLPTVRELGERRAARARGTVREPAEPSLRRERA